MTADASEQAREALRAALTPCEKPDFEGDNCDVWTEKYGQEPCAACARWRDAQPILDRLAPLDVERLRAVGDVVMPRMERALRVASHSPHDQNGEPVEGFPVCSVCGAIQTDPGATDDR